MPAIYGYDDVGNHAMMLVDDVRMRAFAAAIAKSVRPTDVVLDIGSGSGILALLCAKAGARKVYAVERSAMAEVIKQAARDNGFDDVIEVRREDARTVELAEKPTLVVSEMIGSFGIDEDFVGLLGDVARRVATPDCRFLPASVSVRIGIAAIPALQHELTLISTELGVDLRAMHARLVERPALAHIDADELIGDPLPPAVFVPTGDNPRTLTGTVKVTRAARMNAVVGWFDSELCEGVHLTSAPGQPGTHWAHVIFPLDPPIDVAVGDDVQIEVRPRLVADRGSYAWSAKRGTDVRRGDAMQSLVGTRQDVLDQLGIRTAER